MSERHSVSAIFQPLRLQLESERRVQPFQGTVLVLRWEGMDEALANLEGDPAATQTYREGFQHLEQQLVERAERFGGIVLELNGRGVTYYFRDELSLRESVMRALQTSLELRAAGQRWSEALPTVFGKAVKLQFGVASGIFHGFILGTGEVGAQLVFTGAALDEASRASEQAAQLEVLIHPSAGGRIDSEVALTTPPLPTPVVCRLDALHPSVEVEALLSPLTLLEPRRREAQPLSGIQRACFLSIQSIGLDPYSANGLVALNLWYQRSLALMREQGGRLIRLSVGQITLAELVFDTSKSMADVEARTLRTALSLQRVARDLPSLSNQRIGVATGNALFVPLAHSAVPALVASGSRVALARRLAQHAGPWEAVAERMTVSRSGFGFDWGPPPVAASGAEHDLVTSRVLYGEGAYGTRLTSRSRGAIVGREGVMSRLREQADEALAGQGRAVTLVGAPGIGKSALLLAIGTFLQETRRVAVYRGECSALIRNAPYHAWVPVFRDWLDLEPKLRPAELIQRIQERVSSLGADLMPRLPLLSMVTGVRIPENPTTESLDTRQRRNALHSLVLEMFQRAHLRQPVSILFEDAHWMDEASVGLLRYLARNLSNLPCFLLISRRDEEPGQREILNLLESIPGITEIEVSGMSREAMIHLACRHLGARHLAAELESLLIERAEGLPLLLEELTLLMRDAEWIQLEQDGTARLAPDVLSVIPRNLREVILARVARLDEGAQLTLKTASVIGRTFSLSLLREVYPVPFDFTVLMARLERVEGLDIVRQDVAQGGMSELEGVLSHQTSRDPDQPFFFKHALIRDTIYETIPASIRRNLHEAVGAALERRLTENNRASLVLALAEHYRRTTRTDKQRLYLREAGDISRARGQNREAYEFYHAAEQICQLTGSRTELIEILDAQVAVLNLLTDRERQREVISRWKEVVRELDDDLYLCDVLRAEGSLLSRSGEVPRGLALLERSLNIALAKKDEQRAARTLRPICRLHTMQNNLEKALQVAEQALVLARKTNNLQELTGDLANVGFILSRLGRSTEGRQRLNEAFQQAQLRGDIGQVSSILVNIGALEFYDGQLDVAVRIWERAMHLKRQLGDRADEIVLLNNIGFAAHSMGDYARSQQCCLQAIQLSHQAELKYYEVAAHHGLARTLLAQGRLEEARERLQQGITLAEVGGFAQSLEELHEGLADLELREGHFQDALLAVERALVLSPHRYGLQACRAEVLALLGRHDEAIQMAITALEELEKDSEKLESVYNIKYKLSRVFVEARFDLSIRLLQEAREELLQRISKIEDQSLRRQMLLGVPEHRAIQEAWEQLESSIET